MLGSRHLRGDVCVSHCAAECVCVCVYVCESLCTCQFECAYLIVCVGLSACFLSMRMCVSYLSVVGISIDGIKFESTELTRVILHRPNPLIFDLKMKFANTATHIIAEPSCKVMNTLSHVCSLSLPPFLPLFLTLSLSHTLSHTHQSKAEESTASQCSRAAPPTHWDTFSACAL